MTPEQIRERISVLTIDYQAAVKSVGQVKRKIRLIQKNCPHVNAKEVTSLMQCRDCGKVPV